MKIKSEQCSKKESGKETETPAESSKNKLSESTQSQAKSDKSASQPVPSLISKTTEIISSISSQPVGGTLGPASEPTRKPAKRCRPMFGVAAKGGCPKCAQVRSELSHEIGNMKKFRGADKRKFEQEIAELKKKNMRLDETIKFTQGVCSRYIKECEELKKNNFKLLVKLNEIKQIVMK